MIGSNELGSRWLLPIVPPFGIRNRVHADKYMEFAQVIKVQIIIFRKSTCAIMLEKWRDSYPIYFLLSILL